MHTGFTGPMPPPFNLHVPSIFSADLNLLDCQTLGSNTKRKSIRVKNCLVHVDFTSWALSTSIPSYPLTTSVRQSLCRARAKDSACFKFKILSITHCSSSTASCTLARIHTDIYTHPRNTYCWMLLFVAWLWLLCPEWSQTSLCLTCIQKHLGISDLSELLSYCFY